MGLRNAAQFHLVREASRKGAGSGPKPQDGHADRTRRPAFDGLEKVL